VWAIEVAVEVVFVKGAAIGETPMVFIRNGLPFADGEEKANSQRLANAGLSRGRMF